MEREVSEIQWHFCITKALGIRLLFGQCSSEAHVLLLVFIVLVVPLIVPLLVGTTLLHDLRTKHICALELSHMVGTTCFPGYAGQFVGWVGWRGCFYFCVYSMVESNISTMFGCI